MVELLNRDVDFSNIKGIIFDFDGTLYNNVPAIKAAVKTVLSQYEINYPVEKAVEEFKQSLILDPNNEYAKKMLESLGVK